MENYYTKPFHELQGLDEIRLGKIEQGLGIGVEAFDNHIKWKQGQFNMVNGHDNVGKQMYCYGTLFVCQSYMVKNILSTLLRILYEVKYLKFLTFGRVED